MGELGVIKTASKRTAAVLLLFAIGGFLHAMQIAEASQARGSGNYDYASAQQDTLRFEAVVNSVIGDIFSASSFAVVQKTKGAYLAGYGISSAFLVNIHRGVVNTPFGQIKPRSAATAELKKQRIEELKEKLILVLHQSGEFFEQLGKEDHITITAFIEDRNIPDEPNANKTIILTVLKKDMDQFGQRVERLQEFKKRVKIVEY
jgi:hypothetical protein